MTLCTYVGMLIEHDVGESTDVLCLQPDQGYDDPIADLIEGDMKAYGRVASVRYWITDGPEPRESLSDVVARKLEGDLDAKFWVHYSEITGYLWTDEELNVGGHDLLEELRAFKGKRVYLEIDLSPGEPYDPYRRRG